MPKPTPSASQGMTPMDGPYMDTDARIQRVDFHSGEPAIVHLALTVDEAAVLAGLVCRIAPAALTKATGDVRWGNAMSDVSEVLWDFFCRFYDDAIDGFMPKLAVTFDNEAGEQRAATTD